MNTEEILRQVAAGELTPEQALPLLDAATPAAPASVTSAPASEPKAPAEPSLPRETPQPEPDTPPVWGTADSIDASLTESVTAVRVNASYRPVDIVADPTVAQIAVTGQHTVRREGTTLVVESMDSPFHLGEAGEPGTRGQASFTFADLPRGLAWAKSWTEQRLVVRVNPELPVELDAAGASVKISGIEGGAKLRVIAAALKLERVRGPLDLDVLSSSVKGFAAPTGTSKIACESSSVKLLLGAGSDVRITARNRLGKVVLPTAVSKGGLVDPDVTEAVIGAGRGTLTIDAVMSSVMLTRDDA
ncbi:MAG: hypothetical protein IPG94_13195 [Kineosporiaceae bacterium]|nr:hypothetical protein [Kineosporiaceae bacterium]